MERKNWNEFRETGLFWFINSILHVFGWVIVIEASNNEITDVYPARTEFRGFSESSNTKGYQRIAKYLKDHSEELYDEAMK